MIVAKKATTRELRRAPITRSSWNISPYQRRRGLGPDPDVVVVVEGEDDQQEDRGIEEDIDHPGVEAEQPVDGPSGSGPLVHNVLAPARK